MLWGTYDLGKPRNRLMIEAIRRSGAKLTEIHSPIWQGTEDKSVLSPTSAVRRTLSWAAAYPRLLSKFLRAPKPDVVVVGYLGHLDVLVLWPFATLRRTPVIWDAFISLHDTVVDDRKLISARNPIALCLRAWEWLACRAADLVVLDTEAQAAFFRDAYRIDRSKVTAAFVGAEDDIFPALSPTKQGACDTVLFYGQFIPLHGIATIIEAARISGSKRIHWVLIGTGQMAEEIRQLLKTDPPARLKWIEWVSYPELIHHIRGADVCLGVFGESAKAGRVIPNKVFQILSAGRPLVTRDGPGIRELITDDARGVELVPPSDPVSLLTSVERLIASAPYERNLHHDLRERFSAKALSRRWDDILRKAVTS